MAVTPCSYQGLTNNSPLDARSQQPASLACEGWEKQLEDQGIWVTKLATACSLPSIPLPCIEVLCNYEVELASISGRTDEEILEEFNALLDGRLELLQDPEQLDAFLGDLLTENSWELVQRTFLSPNDRTKAKLQEMKEEGRRAFLQTTASETKLSPRAKATEEVLAYIRSPNHTWWGAPQFRFDPTAIGDRECLPLGFLALPPHEAIELIREESCRQFNERPYTMAFLRALPIIPSGIGSLNGVDTLMVRDSTCTSFPESTGKLDINNLSVRNCLLLDHLPMSIRSKQTCRFFTSENGNLKLLEDVQGQPLWGLTIESDTPVDQLKRVISGFHTLKNLRIKYCSQDLLDKLNLLSLNNLSIAVQPNFTHFPCSLLAMGTHSALNVATKTPTKELQKDPVIRALRKSKVIVKFQELREGSKWEPWL